MARFCLLVTTAERSATIYPALVNNGKHRTDGKCEISPWKES